MERYDNIVKSSEIRKLVESRMYQKALSILETIDVNKVKVLTDLSVYAEVYIQTGKYKEAKQLLQRIRQKTNSRRIIAQLIKLSIKSGDEKEAEYYYNEYLQVAPKDADRFILRYRIDKMKGADIDVLISSLEKLKEYDYVEKWSYELAKLYHQAGMKDKCVRECSDIILWFGDGVIVEKAKMLKAVYVGEPKHVETIPAEKKKEIEESKELLKTKDLSHTTKEVNNILNAEDYVNEEKTLEKEQNIQYNHKSIQDMSNIDNKPDEYEYIYRNETLCSIFGQELEKEGIRESIAAYLNQALVQNHANSFAIAGSNPDSRISLAKAMAKAIQELHIFESRKIAKINATKLNQIDLEKNYCKLENSFVVVEDAASLEQVAMEKLMAMLEEFEGRVVVILEDEPARLAAFLTENEVFAAFFHGVIECISYSKEELQEIAIKILNERHFELEEDAYICLETACNQIVVNVLEKDRVNSLKKLIERVIERAEERNVSAITLSNGVIDYDENQLDKITAADF